MALGKNAIGNLLGTVNANGALLVALDGGAATATTMTVDTLKLSIANPDVIVAREAAGHWIQRNSTTAQRASWANTWASTISNELVSVDWQTTANVALVGVRTAATGTGRRIFFAAQNDSGANSYVGMSLLRTATPPLSLGLYNADGATAVSTTLAEIVRLGEFTSTASSGTVVAASVKPTINQSATAGWTALSIPVTETANGSGTRSFLECLGGAAGTTSRFRMDNAGKVATYDSVAAAGQGVEVIRAQATTGTVNNSGTASIATWTPGAADVEVEVSARVNITTSTTHSFSIDVTYTDVANNARTRVLPMYPISGNQLTNSLMTNTVGVGDFASATMRIGVKASTAITVRTSSGGTFTTVTYTASGSIKQVG